MSYSCRGVGCYFIKLYREKLSRKEKLARRQKAHLLRKHTGKLNAERSTVTQATGDGVVSVGNLSARVSGTEWLEAQHKFADLQSIRGAYVCDSTVLRDVLRTFTKVPCV